ncbi:MAG TPA: hypothetical protein VMW54_13300 [Terriglobia bacterium]|nr:hypothetical protein [Terriglobia bacterium]
MGTLNRHSQSMCVGVALAIILVVAPLATFAQTDEVQVYDGVIEVPGKANVMVHSNFTPIGRKSPDFPGGIIPDDSVNGAVEWAYGVKPWFEQGLYLPVYTAYSKEHGGSINGFKIRELFVRPHARRHKYFYGVNFEFSVNRSFWESRRITSEVRGILGAHLRKWDLIYNPIFDTDYTGGVRGLEFVPAERIAYNLNDNWAVAAEQYSDFGPLRDFYATNNQFHEVWAVVDHHTKFVDIETGVGVGVTDGADKLTFKLMLSRDLN